MILLNEIIQDDIPNIVMPDTGSFFETIESILQGTVSIPMIINQVISLMPIVSSLITISVVIMTFGFMIRAWRKN